MHETTESAAPRAAVTWLIPLVTDEIAPVLGLGTAIGVRSAPLTS